MQRFPRFLSRATRPGVAATLAGLALLTACGGGGDAGPAAEPASPGGALSISANTDDPMEPTNWSHEFSSGVRPHPRPLGGGWVIDLPYPSSDAGSVHYVTMPTAPLAGKTRITMHYRIEADAGVRILPRRFPAAPSILTLYFQRNGDDWTAQGPYEAYRWYASFASRKPLAPNGDEVMEARLDQNWTAVSGSSRGNNPAAFTGALAETGRVGFVLGGGDGLGHGVYATGPARLVVTSFKVE